MTLLWSSSRWGLALKKGVEDSDEPRLRFLSFWIRRSRFMHRNIIHLYVFYVLGPTGEQFSLVQVWAASAARSLLSSFFFHDRLRRSFAPWLPKAHSTITNTAFTPASTAGDVNRTMQACTGLQGPTLRAACCSTAPNNKVCAFKFYSQQRYCSHLVFLGGHHPSHSRDIMDKNNPTYTIIKSALLQLGNV